MQRLAFTILLTLCLVGVIKAQESAGNTAEPDEQVKKEMLKYENDVVEALLKGGSVAADFFDRTNAEDMVSNGKMSSKAAFLDAWRSGAHKQLSVDHHDFRVHVYGNTAVVTFSGNNTTDNKGKISHSSYMDTDVLVKQKGVWQRVVHDVSSVPTQ
jgi:ketosteroid isomerase-like protein